MPKRTYQPALVTALKHGFRARLTTKAGRLVLSAVALKVAQNWRFHNNLPGKPGVIYNRSIMLAATNRFHGHGSLKYLYKNGTAVRSHWMTIKYIANHAVKPRASVLLLSKVHKSAVGHNRIRHITCMKFCALNSKFGVYDITVIISSRSNYRHTTICRVWWRICCNKRLSIHPVKCYNGNDNIAGVWMFDSLIVQPIFNILVLIYSIIPGMTLVWRLSSYDCGPFAIPTAQKAAASVAGHAKNAAKGWKKSRCSIKTIGRCRGSPWWSCIKSIMSAPGAQS